MKKFLLSFLSIYSLLIITSCASHSVPQNTASPNDGLRSLVEAIDQSALELSNRLPAGARVTIVSFRADSENFADYIMEELAAALVNTNLEVADRSRLEQIKKELDLQYSGDVNDETMQSLGKFAGTEFIITGDLLNIGEKYRYRVTVTNTETGVRAGSAQFNVRKDWK
jgi:TolB-like protein